MTAMTAAEPVLSAEPFLISSGLFPFSSGCFELLILCCPEVDSFFDFGIFVVVKDAISEGNCLLDAVDEIKGYLIYNTMVQIFVSVNIKIVLFRGLRFIILIYNH